MKFKKICNEIQEIKSQKRLDEALLTDIIDNWPVLIVDQYKFDHATDEKEKASYDATLNKNIIPINTTTNTKDKWIGDFAKDFVEMIRKRPYQSSTYTIKGTQINIKYGMNNEWVDYLRSPTAAALINRVYAQLQKQKNSNQQIPNNAPSPTGMPPDQQPLNGTPQTPSATPSAANKIVNKLSTI